MISISRILIDGTSLRRKTTGIEYYTLQIINNLLKYDCENEYIILFRHEVRSELKEYESKAKFIVCSIDNQLFCEQVWIPYIINKYKPDVVHFPAFPPGALVNHKKMVFTLHDATMWKYKETLSWKNKLYMRPLSERAIRKSKYVFTVSQNSKENIDDVFNRYKEKIVVTGESISDKFKTINDFSKINETKLKFNTGEKYLLSVCSLEPRKNIPMLLKAFKNVVENKKYSSLKLVLVGRRAWGENIIDETIQALNLINNVIITDYVSDSDLLYLYNGAYCFIYPSLYEGFGLPVLEAMACGIPVITSNNSSLPEVCGDASILIDPCNKEEISSSLINILENNELRNDMIQKGKGRLKEFSWRKITNNMVRLYLED